MDEITNIIRITQKSGITRLGGRNSFLCNILQMKQIVETNITNNKTKMT